MCQNLCVVGQRTFRHPDRPCGASHPALHITIQKTIHYELGIFMLNSAQSHLLNEKVGETAQITKPFTHNIMLHLNYDIGKFQYFCGSSSNYMMYGSHVDQNLLWISEFAMDLSLYGFVQCCTHHANMKSTNVKPRYSGAALRAPGFASSLLYSFITTRAEYKFMIFA